MTEPADPTPTPTSVPGPGPPGAACSPVALLLEQRERWAHGDRVPVERLLEKVQPGTADPEAVLDLIYNEFLLREEAGEDPQPGDYFQRFPQFADELRVLFVVDRAVSGRGGGGTTDSGQTPVSCGSSPSPSAGRLLSLPGYEVLGELGRGGMAVVYRARQLSLDRIVAVKVLQAAALASGHQLARFLREAEAVARLQHPNIVQIHEVGEHDGCPYLALEFIEGGSLAQKAAGAPQPSREAARLVETLARAVHYAHQKGVIHRDLKPANILLTAAGQPKVADFGLAKCLELEGITHSEGAILGTPSYMAPEQARGKAKAITPLADVYSLGSILYELLTGRPPFRGETTMDTLSQVLGDEPVAPRLLQPKVPRDLETVCLKCLEKEPHRRYPSAEALAEDLHRFLAGEPIQARPTPPWERGLKWARRRPAPAALLAVSVLAVVTLLLGAVWHDAQMRTERAQARSSAAAAERERTRAAELARQAGLERDRARESLRVGRKAVDNAYITVSQNLLLNTAGAQPVRKALLQSALDYYTSFLRVWGDDPELQEEVALTSYRVGYITDEIGSKADALAAFQRARDLFQGLATARPADRPVHYRLAYSQGSVANLERRLGRTTAALHAYQESAATFTRLVETDAADTQARAGLAMTWSNVGALHSELGRLDEALRAHAEALRVREHLAQAEPGRPDRRFDLARSLDSLGRLEAVMGKSDPARVHLERARDLRARIVRASPNQADYQNDLAVSHLHLGDLHGEADRQAEALAAYGEARRILEKLVADNPAVVEYQRNLATTLEGIAAQEHGRGNLPEALGRYRKARDLRERLAHNNPAVPVLQSELATTCRQLGRLLAETGALPEGCVALARARDLYLPLVRYNPEVFDYRWGLGKTLDQLGEVRQRRGRAGGAEAAFGEAVRHLRLAFDGAPQAVDFRQALGDCYAHLAQFHRQQGRPAEAAAAVRARRLLWPDDPAEWYRAACELAQCLPLVAEPAERQACADEAMEALRRAVARGFKDAGQLEANADFAPLRTRDDFRELLGRLKK
jgi:serine/threonine protein kinase